MPSPNEDLTVNSTRGYITIDNQTGNQTGGLITTSPGLSLRRVRTTVSVRTPNFKKLKKGQLPINEYSYTQQITSDPVVAYQCTVPQRVWPENPSQPGVTRKYQTNCAEQYCSFDSITPADDPYPGAVQKLLRDIAEGKTNTMVTAAEFGKTVALVAKTATRIRASIKALKRGDFRTFTEEIGLTSTTYQRRRFNKQYDRARRADFVGRNFRKGTRSPPITENRESHLGNFLADTWLEYSYGWKPLLKDIYDHAVALYEINNKNGGIIRFASARHKTSLKPKWTKTESLWKWTRDQNESRFAEVGVRYRNQGSSVNAFTQLGINNPMEVVWELIPFSFVADWFIPVGDYLRSLTATMDLVFVDGYKTIRNVFELNTSYVSSGSFVLTGGTKLGPMTGSGKAYRFRMDQVRTKLTAFPSPSLPAFKLPPQEEKNNYGLNKALSAISLLQSLFLREKSTGSKSLRI